MKEEILYYQGSNAQADLHLCCSHMAKQFSHDVAHMIKGYWSNFRFITKTKQNNNLRCLNICQFYGILLQGGHPNESPEADAAVCIQRWYRGFRGRKIYAEKLFEQFEKVCWTSQRSYIQESRKYGSTVVSAIASGPRGNMFDPNNGQEKCVVPTCFINVICKDDIKISVPSFGWIKFCFGIYGLSEKCIAVKVLRDYLDTW